jgi:hypothetical protein
MQKPNQETAKTPINKGKGCVIVPPTPTMRKISKTKGQVVRPSI